MRYGVVIDLKRCIGCDSCVTACKSYNYTPPGVFWAKVLEKEMGKYPNVRKLFLPVLCNHCDDPPCRDACPTGATIKREEDGIVLIDYDKCIGCRACMAACPYDARTYVEKLDGYFPTEELAPNEKIGRGNQQKGVVTKCILCFERLQLGKEPACIEVCPTKARYFGDLDDPESQLSQLIANNRGTQLRSEEGTNPSVYYIN